MKYLNMLFDFIWERIVLILIIQFPILEFIRPYRLFTDGSILGAVVNIAVSLAVTCLVAAILHPFYKEAIDHIKQQLK